MMRSFLTCLVAVCCWSANLMAADVDADVSTRETYVGLPIVLRIHINNATEYEAPIMPDVDGLEIEPTGPPSRSSRIMSINGRRTQRTTVSYAFRVTPLRAGSFTIPPVEVEADGLSTMTKAVRIVATKSETNDLMFVEIEGNQSDIYVGEALDLSLKVWIRPYRNRDYRIDFDEGQMWQLISEQSAWGPFEDRLAELAQNRRRPGGRRVLREDSSGEQREYFLYEIETTIYPDRPTTITGEDIRIILNYPVELGRSRSPFSMLDEEDFFDDDFFGGSLFDDSLFRSFGSRLTITKSRPIIAEASVDPIRVQPVPTTGRPSDYVGAVGQYTISTTATPQSVQVGDPITLHLTVEGDGAMDVVRAPPLSLQQDLVRDFKVPDEPLAGVVQGSSKQFTTTLRPLHEGVTQIPAIEYTYFDPKSERFVTAKSDPIPIEVTKAEMLALDAVVGDRGPTLPRSPVPSESVPAGQELGPMLFSGKDVLKSAQPFKLWTTLRLSLLIGPPLVFLAALLFALRTLPAAFLSPGRRFRRSLERAESGSQVADALEGFLARRYQIAASHLTRDRTIGSLRGAGRPDLAIRVERIYHGKDRLEKHELEARKREAAAIVGDLSRSRLWPGSHRGAPSFGSTAATGWIALAAIALGQATTIRAASIELTMDQKEVLLAEGVDAFQSAVENPDRIEAKEQFDQAFDSFRLLVDAGIENDRLYFNLAESAMGADRVGLAIANYRRALRLRPDHSLYHQRLQDAESKVSTVAPREQDLLSLARRLNDGLLRWIPASGMLFGFFVGWLIFWIALSGRAIQVLHHWIGPTVFACLLALLCGGSYLLRVSEFTRDDLAVINSPAVSMRAGDGEEFPEIVSIDNSLGKLVTILDRRGSWLQVASGPDQKGWIRAGSDAIAVVKGSAAAIASQPAGKAEPPGMTNPQPSPNNNDDNNPAPPSIDVSDAQSV